MTNTVQRRFCIHKHQATHLHYDFRLEYEGVLKSWAIPKGPSTDPSVKRLAIAVDDHPLDYVDFEGIIDEGSYGAGEVIVWDIGTYEDETDGGMARGLEKGTIKFTLKGKKIKGSWALVQMRGKNRPANQWLLIKHKDQFADADEDILETRPESAISGKTIEDVKRDEG